MYVDQALLPEFVAQRSQPPLTPYRRRTTIWRRRAVHRLPDQIPHQASRRLPPGPDRPQRAHAARLAEALIAAVLAAVRQLAPIRHPAQERPARPGPRPLQGQGPGRRPPRLRGPPAFNPAQVASPLVRRPYDFRHAGISWRLNAGTPGPQVAEWAGHSVEVLYRIYAHCLEGGGRAVAPSDGGSSWLALSPGPGCLVFVKSPG